MIDLTLGAIPSVIIIIIIIIIIIVIVMIVIIVIIIFISIRDNHIILSLRRFYRVLEFNNILNWLFT